MLRHDESELLRSLRGISSRAQSAFAAACAERLFPSYVLFCELSGRGDHPALADILECAWNAVLVRQVDMSLVRAALSRCMTLIPDENDDPYTDEQPYAEDAAAAVAYVLRGLETADPQEAAWAARRAYEAVDHYVTHHLDIEDEDQVLGHPLIQAELARQLRDLDCLDTAESKLTDVIMRLRDVAKSEARHLLGPS